MHTHIEGLSVGKYKVCLPVCETQYTIVCKYTYLACKLLLFIPLCTTSCVNKVNLCKAYLYEYLLYHRIVLHYKFFLWNNWTHCTYIKTDDDDDNYKNILRNKYFLNKEEGSKNCMDFGGIVQICYLV